MYRVSSYGSFADVAEGAIIGMIGIVLVILLVVLLVSLIPAIVSAKIANNKGYSGVGYFFLAFFFGVIGVLLVVALPDKKVQHLLEQIANNTANPVQSDYAVPSASNTYSAPAPAAVVAPEPVAQAPFAPVVPEVQGPKVCPNCQKEVLKDAQFCKNCGTKL